jgi:hypothetical protein
LAVALAKVLSKFLVRILHLSIQAFERSIIHLALTGTNPDLPKSSFCCFDGNLHQFSKGDNQLEYPSRFWFKPNDLKKELLGAIYCCERSLKDVKWIL